MNIKRTGKLLVVGWDAAEWGVIDSLLQQGKMPALQKLMSEGCYARLKTLDPPLSPMLWTSIATGFRADKHGICGFVEPLPDGEGLRPVTSTSRKVKAFWNIFTQENLKSNVIAWWPSNPVEKINGIMVSNLYQVANKPLEEEWKMAEGTIHPKEMEDLFKEFRVHPAEITPTMVLPFIPNIRDNEELRKDKRTLSVAKIIANAASVHAASTYVMQESEWDVTAVYHDAIDHFCHVAMKYHPPRREHINEKDFEDFKEVVEAGYRFHDMMLERTLDLIDEDTTVILLSDHGFYPDHRRPKAIPKEPSGPAAEHSPYGILVMKGPGIRKGGVEFTGASVIDITPTMLAIMGLPVGKDMEGKVLYQTFEDPTPVDFIDSWENVEGETGMHNPDEVEDPWAAQEALQQLVELGYIEELDDDKLEQVEKAKKESEYYVARNMIDGGRLDMAIPILERIFKDSKIIRYGQRLAFAYLSQRNYEKATAIIHQLRALEKEEHEARKKAKEENKDKNKKDPFLNLEFEEPLYIDFIEGLMLLMQNRPLKALKLLEKVQEKNPNNIEVPLNIAKIYRLRKNYSKAEKQYIKALAIDEKHAPAHYGLGVCYLRMGKLELAFDELMSAVEFNFYLPNAHYHIGETLFKLGNFEHAVEAFKTAIHFSPGMTKAHKWLVSIFNDRLDDKENAKYHEEFLKNNIRGEVVVVTGLEQSGEKEIISLLQSGGYDILSEQLGSDVKKPQFSKLKELQKSFDQKTAIQVSGQLLSFLPTDLSYKFIIAEREMSDLVSDLQQRKSVVKSDNALPLKLYNATLERKEKMDQWLMAQPNVDLIRIKYDDLNENIKEQKEIIFDFLGHDL